MFQDMIIITKKKRAYTQNLIFFYMLYIPKAGLATVDHPAFALELFGTIHSFFYK